MEVSVMKAAGDASKTTQVVVQLINARGDMIWPNAASRRNYRGSVIDISSSIVKDLLAAIQKSKQQR
jgi:hypothetical protein